MPGFGTLINVALIVAGGLVGLLASSFVTDRLQDTLLRSCGVCIIFVGAAGTMQHMLVATAGADGSVTLSTVGTMMLVVSLAIGSVLGEAADIEGRFERLGEWLRDRTGSSGDTRFVDGFVTASFAVCVGAMTALALARSAVRRRR